MHAVQLIIITVSAPPYKLLSGPLINRATVSPDNREIVSEEQALPIKFVSSNGQFIRNKIDLLAYFDTNMKGIKSMMVIRQYKAGKRTNITTKL